MTQIRIGFKRSGIAQAQRLLFFRNPETPERAEDQEKLPSSEKQAENRRPDAQLARRERREQRERQESWSRTLEQLTQSEVYDLTISLTKIQGQFQKMQEKMHSPKVQENLDAVTERLTVARVVRAEMNGWVRESSEELQLRLDDLEQSLRTLQPRIAEAKEQAAQVDSPRPVLSETYINLPAGLQPSDILRLLVQDEIRLTNDRDTIRQVLKSRN